MATEPSSGGGDSQPKKSTLYTRTGDDGSTGLFSGARVGKDDARIEAYGAVDELNSCVGWARSELELLRTARAAGAAHAAGAPGAAPAAHGVGASSEVDLPALEMIGRILEALQNRLFELGADLATPPGSRFEARVSRIGDTDVCGSESWIDEADAGNAPLRSFVLPGGSELASRLHLARTQCRRAERSIVVLSRREPVGDAVIQFVNRVSDLLFALARRANSALRVPDVPWSSRSPQ